MLARICLLVVVIAAVVGGVFALRPSAPPPPASPPPASSPPSAPLVPIPPAAPAPAGLPVLNYWGAPGGFPADPAQLSTVAATEGVHTADRRIVYDAPGGHPRAWLPASISGVQLTVPIVDESPGWVAVLLPSINRRVGWLTTGGWTPQPLPDQLILHRVTHSLTWLHNGTQQAKWTVATGTAATPTPLGRTFVLGRNQTSGKVYAGLDALLLGSVPDHPEALSPGLRDGHTAIHSWYRSNVFGHSASNGCIRLPRKAQQTLLKSIRPGTELTVLN